MQQIILYAHSITAYSLSRIQINSYRIFIYLQTGITSILVKIALSITYQRFYLSNKFERMNHVITVHLLCVDTK